jgi:hypothetical protein
VDTTTLLAETPDGSRRTSVLKLDDDSISVRAKVYKDEEGRILQYRAYIDELDLYHHIFVDTSTGAVAAVTTGTQDGDAFERGKQELLRRGIDLS